MPTRTRVFYAAWIVAILAIVAALGGMAGRAKAGSVECASIDATQAAIAKSGGTSEILTPEESRLYIEALNKEPPVSHLAGDRVLFVVLPDGRVALGLVVGTRVCPVGSVAADLHTRLLDGAREHRA